MFVVTIIEDSPNEDLVVLNRVFNKKENAIKYLSDTFLLYEDCYGNDEELDNENFNCSCCFFMNGEEIKYVDPYDERITTCWIDNERCCITLQLNEQVFED